MFTDQSVTAVSRRTIGAFAEHLVRQSTTMLLQPNNNNSTHTHSLSLAAAATLTAMHSPPPAGLTQLPVCSLYITSTATRCSAGRRLTILTRLTLPTSLNYKASTSQINTEIYSVAQKSQTLISVEKWSCSTRRRKE